MTTKFYIDAHVHFFSAGHIPLQQTIDRLLNKTFGSTGSKLTAAAGLSVAAPLIPLLPLLENTGAVEGRIERIKGFIEFFDTDAAFSINKAVTSSEGIYFISDYDNRIKLFTPLVMDFEYSVVDYNPNYVGQKLLKDQVKNLTQEANSLLIKEKLINNKWLVLPFLGLDLRRFDNADNIEHTLEQLIALNSSGLNVIELNDFEQPFEDLYQQYNGGCIGLKIYPSLGCDVWPEDEQRRAINIELIKTLAQKQYPVTVHCQKDSYESGNLDLSDETLINYANPKKWQNLLNAADNPKLFLNFAHFGGEEGVKRLVNWRSWRAGDRAQYKNKKLFEAFDRDTKSWTYRIIKLLKTQQNIYSDLAAFDFEDQKAVASFLWLLYLDEQGQLDDEFPNSQYKLKDKILFGTDVPMTMYQYPEYKAQVKAFYQCMKGNYSHKFMFVLPPSAWFNGNSNEYIENFINHNPAAFLFKR
ncbi:hypothetical protein [Thalassotalea sp. PLHSN55]|uniref:hypothetical protein n=1 Tax=Thalassotalea sp. PLHSN55 TaxID=3435888 RepID=UPI003F841B1A